MIRIGIGALIAPFIFNVVMGYEFSFPAPPWHLIAIVPLNCDAEIINEAREMRWQGLGIVIVWLHLVLVAEVGGCIVNNATLLYNKGVPGELYNNELTGASQVDFKLRRVS